MLRVVGAMFLVIQLAGAEDQGWHPLFDGSTPNGWVEATGKPFPAGSWTIEDNCLKAKPHSDGFHDIRTVTSFTSFELQFEWKLSKLGDAGVKYLMQDQDRGPAVATLEDINSPGIGDPTHLTGGLYAIFAPSGANWRIGVFNESRVIVHGSQVEHWLNGVRVLSFETTNPAVQTFLQGTPQKPLIVESPISLQSRSAETWFRNIKIRMLP